MLTGCQSDDAAVYDAAALNQARAAARDYGRAWPGFGKPITVETPEEREYCEARTYHSDPCVAVPTVHRMQGVDIRGEIYVWLARERDNWRVVDTDYFTSQVRTTIVGGEPAPPWVRR
jgi:hypothetical protein